MNNFVRLTLLVLITTSLGFVGKCNKSIDMQVAPGFPAATGKVKVGKDKNENTVAELTVKNLAPPNG